MRALFAGLALALSLPMTTAHAAAPTGADEQAIRWIVKREIKALQRDHADAAYAFVSPKAHAIFPSKEIYMTKMLEQFPSLAYAVHVEIGELRETSKGLAQMVTLVDRRGRSFVAFFFMENLPEQGWVIHNFIMTQLKTTEV
jgi:hypothetical protein